MANYLKTNDAVKLLVDVAIASDVSIAFGVDVAVDESETGVSLLAAEIVKCVAAASAATDAKDALVAHTQSCFSC